MRHGGNHPPVVKHNFLVKDVRDLAMVMKKAFHIARSGRPGPVVVDIPKDVSFNKTAYSGYPSSIEMRSYNPVRKGHGGQIRKALQLLLSAKRPYIYTGGGVLMANASNELRALVDMLGYPCTNTLMGLGAYPATDPKFLGMLGMHGTIEANNAMQHCDVLLAVGARFDDRVIGNPKHFAQNERKIIHIDIDPSSISKRVKVDIPIVGDVRDVLTELLAMIRESGLKPDAQALASWWESIDGWRKRDCLSYDRSSRDVIKPQRVIETLWNMTRDADAYITSDVGQHQMWAAQYYKFNEPRRWINSGGLGTMGVGIPYAMGIKLAKPDSECYCITGEGSVQMCIQELSTCLQYNTPIKIVALNNRYLGMVRQWQELDYEGRYSHSYMDALPNFVKLAEAYGHVGMLIEKPQDVEPALREARKLKDRTVFMDFRTDPTENVFPMVRRARASPKCCWVGRPVSAKLFRLPVAAVTARRPGRIYCSRACKHYRSVPRGGQRKEESIDHETHHCSAARERARRSFPRRRALFSARGYNIESLTVAPTEDPSLSRMTIVTTGSDDVIEQITKHLNRLIEVVKVVDLTEGAYTERELMLVKVRAVGKEREEMKRMADIFRGRIIDVTEKSYTIELTGDQSKNDAFLECDRSQRHSWKPCAPVPAGSAAVSGSCAFEVFR
jgi:acetolactate synthase-1/2/3 large subunit